MRTHEFVQSNECEVSLQFEPTELSFAHLRSTRPRKEKCRAIVVHHTGGSRSPVGVYATLKSRTGPRAKDGLSVHYVIGVDGKVYQFAPADLVCLHAGIANEWSVGIEVCSAGVFNSISHKLELSRGISRQKYSDRIHRRERKLLDFTVWQYASLFQLIDYLCDRLSIPRRVPELDGELIKRDLSSTELAAFSGVLGHYHVSAAKIDPGTRPLVALQEKFSVP